jgi:nucleoside 2-deoxyribosyltransferase
MKAATTVYISGPMTGYEDLNFPAFNNAARALRLIGYTVINPAEFQTDTSGMDQDAAWCMYMRQDIKALMDCDAIVMLPEWPDSKGAVIERDLAIKLGMPVLTLAEAIITAPAAVQNAQAVAAEAVGAAA